jgi:hypothetical protein
VSATLADNYFFFIFFGAGGGGEGGGAASFALGGGGIGPYFFSQALISLLLESNTANLFTSLIFSYGIGYAINGSNINKITITIYVRSCYRYSINKFYFILALRHFFSKDFFKAFNILPRGILTDSSSLALK